MNVYATVGIPLLVVEGLVLAQPFITWPAFLGLLAWGGTHSEVLWVFYQWASRYPAPSVLDLWRPIMVYWTQLVLTLVLMRLAECTGSESDHPRYSLVLLGKRVWQRVGRGAWKDFRSRLRRRVSI